MCMIHNVSLFKKEIKRAKKIIKKSHKKMCYWKIVEIKNDKLTSYFRIYNYKPFNTIKYPITNIRNDMAIENGIFHLFRDYNTCKNILKKTWGFNKMIPVWVSVKDIITVGPAYAFLTPGIQKDIICVGARAFEIKEYDKYLTK